MPDLLNFQEKMDFERLAQIYKNALKNKERKTKQNTHVLGIAPDNSLSASTIRYKL